MRTKFRNCEQANETHIEKVYVPENLKTTSMGPFSNPPCSKENRHVLTKKIGKVNPALKEIFKNMK